MKLKLELFEKKMKEIHTLKILIILILFEFISLQIQVIRKVQNFIKNLVLIHSELNIVTLRVGLTNL